MEPYTEEELQQQTQDIDIQNQEEQTSDSESSEDGPVLSQEKRNSLISSKPKWLEDVENSLNKFDNQYNKAKRGTQILQNGLSEFNRKQSEQLKIDKEVRLRNWQKKMSMEFEKNDKKQNLDELKRHNNIFNRLNSHLWLIIFQFIDRNVFYQVTQLSRICRKAYQIQQNPSFYEYQASLYFGENFLKINENNATNIQQIFRDLQGDRLSNQKDETELQRSDFWKYSMINYAFLLEKTKITFQKYQNSGCPLESSVLFPDLVYSLNFISDVISLVFLNQDKQFLLYQIFIDFLLNTPGLKGIYILTRLVQFQSELIYNDAVDILISLCSLEKMIRLKMKVYLPVNKLVKTDQISAQRILKLLINSEFQDKIGDLNNILKMTKIEQFMFPTEDQLKNERYSDLSFDRNKFVKKSEFCVFGQLSFNKVYSQKLKLIKTLNYSVKQNVFKFDFENNDELQNKLLSLYEQNKIQFATGAYLDRDNGELIQFNCNPTFSLDGDFHALGYNENGEQISINGTLNIQSASAKIKRNYDFDLNLQSLGQGKILWKIGSLDKIEIKIFAMHGINLYYNQQVLQICGAYDNFQKIVTIQVQL